MTGQKGPGSAATGAWETPAGPCDVGFLAWGYRDTICNLDWDNDDKLKNCGSPDLKSNTWLKPTVCVLMKLDDGWPESVEEQGLLLLAWRHNFTNNIWKMCYRQPRRGVARQNSEKCKTIVCIANTFTHRRFYTQKLLHTEALTHRPLYTQIYLQRNAFTQRRFYIETSSHRDVAACFFTFICKAEKWSNSWCFRVFWTVSEQKTPKKKTCFLTPRKPGAFWSQLVGLSRLAGRQLKGPSGIKGKRPFLAKSWPKPFGASF